MASSRQFLSLVDYQNTVAALRTILEQELREARNGATELVALKKFNSTVSSLTARLVDCDFKRAFGQRPGIAFLNPSSPSPFINMLSVGKKSTRLTSMTPLDNPTPSRIDPKWLLDLFCDQELLKPDEAIELIHAARGMFTKEDNVLEIQAPVTVVGDVHGQFFDVVKAFDLAGAPSLTNTYLFLGDYVDRGAFSCEVSCTFSSRTSKISPVFP
eukprot:c42232_g1_i1.p1 GENE.c42232_g1_i1~~c42232_g1_i1.p1  ORF type:complete len:230 (+),score=46.62 c42232_g1_i1:49-690(+)